MQNNQLPLHQQGDHNARQGPLNQQWHNEQDKTREKPAASIHKATQRTNSTNTTVHYENTPIQMYRKFRLQKPKIFR